jgi:hypothetical protein
MRENLCAASTNAWTLSELDLWEKNRRVAGNETRRALTVPRRIRIPGKGNKKRIQCRLFRQNPCRQYVNKLYPVLIEARA